MPGALKLGFPRFHERDTTILFGLSISIKVARVRDVVVHRQSPESIATVAEAIIRTLGVELTRARRLANTPLPDLPAASIEWEFQFASPGPILDLRLSKQVMSVGSNIPRGRSRPENTFTKASTWAMT